MNLRKNCKVSMTIRTLKTTTVFFKLNFRCCEATPLWRGLQRGQDRKWGQCPRGGRAAWGRGGGRFPGSWATYSQELNLQSVGLMWFPSPARVTVNQHTKMTVCCYSRKGIELLKKGVTIQIKQSLF